MNLTFNEKSLWISITIMTVVWVWYFSHIWSGLWSLSLGRAESVALSAVVVGALIVLQIVLHIIVAVLNPAEADDRTDERDRTIGRKAGYVAGWVLSVGVVLTWALASLVDLPSIILANVLLLILILHQITNDALMLVFHRKGV
jgi:hypothetical protein